MEPEKDRDISSPDLNVSGVFSQFFARERGLRDSLLDFIRLRAAGHVAPLSYQGDGPFAEFFPKEAQEFEKKRDEELAWAAQKIFRHSSLIFEDRNELHLYLAFYREVVSRVSRAEGALDEKLMKKVFGGVQHGVVNEHDPKASYYLLDTAYEILTSEEELAHGRTSYQFRLFKNGIGACLDQALSRLLPYIRREPTSELTTALAGIFSDLAQSVDIRNPAPFYELAKIVENALDVDDALEALSAEHRSDLEDLSDDLLSTLSYSGNLEQHKEFWLGIANGEWVRTREMTALRVLADLDPNLVYPFVGRILSEYSESYPRSTRIRVLILLRAEEEGDGLAKSIASLGPDAATAFLEAARTCINFNDDDRIQPRVFEQHLDDLVQFETVAREVANILKHRR